MNGNYFILYEVAMEFAELVGKTNIKLNDKQMKTILKVADPIWTSENTQSALKHFVKLSEAVGDINRKEFGDKLIDHLKHRHSDFEDRICQDSAGQLVAAIRG
jgi:hypothetical protein